MMGEWLVLIVILWCVNQTKSDPNEVNKSFLAIKEGCVCSGYNLILECTIVAKGTQRGSTVWNGTHFDCPNSNNAITLLHNRFLSESGNCNNGSIEAKSLRVDENTYTSQINITINSNILGQTITCQYYDNIMTSTIGSIKLTQEAVVTAQFNTSMYSINYFMANDVSGKTISFTWRLFKISMCSVIPYIIASNCGSCPTNTNYSNITCIDVPSDATHCTFALIPTICGEIAPNLSIFLDVKLKDSNEGLSGLIGACVFLTIITIVLLILIGIAVLFRFKDYVKRIFQFRFEIPIGRCSANLCRTNQRRESERQLRCHYTSQCEEIGIYSYVDKEDSDETNGDVLKIFDNKSKEKGIYGIDNDHGVECTDCPANKATSQNVNSLSATKASDTTPSASLNLEDLLIKLDDEVKSQWYKFGEVIGVPLAYLDALSGEEETQCLKNVLDHWLRHHPGQPMWEEVAKAKRKVKLLNQFELKDKVADHAVEVVPPPKPPRRRSSVNRSHSLSTAPIKTASEQQETLYDTLR